MKPNQTKRIIVTSMLLYFLGAIGSTYSRNKEADIRYEKESNPACNADKPIRQRLDAAEGRGKSLETVNAIKYPFVPSYRVADNSYMMACSDMTTLGKREKQNETAVALDRARRIEAINRWFVFWLVV